jgi:hypothetical protein
VVILKDIDGELSGGGEDGRTELLQRLRVVDAYSCAESGQHFGAGEAASTEADHGYVFVREF